MLLIRKSRKLIIQYASERTPTLAWLTQCSEICTELWDHVQSVSRLITRFAASNDHDSCVSLRTCSVVCLSNLAELYHILSHHPLWKLPGVAIVQYERAMYHMADISNELMNDDDLRHLPSYAGSSWVHTTMLLRREVAVMSLEGFTTHPEKGVDELRKCIGTSIAFMTATSDRFYLASSFENPSGYWGNLIPAD